MVLGMGTPCFSCLSFPLFLLVIPEGNLLFVGRAIELSESVNFSGFKIYSAQGQRQYVACAPL
jgi:hypothetical protein